jgi:hypothetical protein
MIAVVALRTATRGNDPRPRVWRRLSVIALLAIWLGGCTTGFVYNRLDWVVSWYVNGLVSLDDAQEAQLKSMVQQTLDWHRRSQLPRYVSLLEQLDRETDQPVTAQAFERRYQEIGAMLDDFLRQVLPGAAGLLRTLTPEQIAELGESLTEDNEEIWDEFAGATPAVRQKRRVRSTLRALRRFTGPLSSAQRAMVETHLTTMHDVSERWLDRRRHWQDRFLGLLQTPTFAAEFEAALLDLALNPDQFDSGDYRQKVDENRAIIMNMLAELTNSLSGRQRDHLGRKFNEYAADLRRIGADD